MFTTKTEAHLFCLILVIFLYVFKEKTFLKRSALDRITYLFVSLGIFLSILYNAFQATVFAIFFGVSTFLSVFSMCAYAFGKQNIEKSNFKRGVHLLIGLATGGMSFHVCLQGSVLAVYFLVLAILFVFSVELYNKVRTDRLTQIYNRYGLDMELKEQLAQYRKEKDDSFYIISCDVDRFKEINDKNGHMVGDRVLRRIAGALAKACWKFDAEPFRIGGDEFIIITDKSDEGLAGAVIEEVKNQMQKVHFGKNLTVAISMGYIKYNGETDINALLESVDKKLYEAKRSRK